MDFVQLKLKVLPGSALSYLHLGYSRIKYLASFGVIWVMGSALGQDRGRSRRTDLAQRFGFPHRSYTSEKGHSFSHYLDASEQFWQILLAYFCAETFPLQLK